MDAVVFAAGLGARLAPLTDRMPKALVEVGGVPMLERVARRLVAAGALRLVVNVCPFAEEIAAFVGANAAFGVETIVAREAPAPFDTGGGLAAMRGLLRGEGPFLLHNVDVVTDLPLADVVAAQKREAPLATLCVMERETSRRLLFDDVGLLGRVDDAAGPPVTVRPPRGRVRELGFAGVHAASRALLARLARGTYSILEPYLAAAKAGERVLPHRVDGCRWIDVGRPADLARANAALAPARA